MRLMMHDDRHIDIFWPNGVIGVVEINEFKAFPGS